MRVLILGVAGMLGHKVWQTLRPRFDTFGTVRGKAEYYRRFGIFDLERIKGKVDARSMDNTIDAMAWARPNVVINCIGIIKQVKEAEDPIVSLEINSLLPHRLLPICRASGARLLHISTDRVFFRKDGKLFRGVSE